MVIQTITGRLTQTSGTWTATCITRGRVCRITLDWISTAGGEAVCSLSGVYGILKRIATVPGAATPSNNYTLSVRGPCPTATIHSAANSNTAGNEFSLSVADDGAATFGEPLILDTLTFSIASAGNTKAGTIHLYFDLLS